MNDEVISNSEYAILEACLKWGQAESTKTGKSLKDALGEIRNHIRYPVISSEKFCDKIQPLGIVDPQDCQLLEHYWKLRETDPISAEAMDLPFKKTKRTGKLYSASFFKRKPSTSVWAVPADTSISIKFWSECSIAVHSILMYGKPEQGKTLQVKAKLLEKLGSGNGSLAYNVVLEQDAILRITTDNSSRLEFETPLVFTAGAKYQLRLRFIQWGLRDCSKGKAFGSMWKERRVDCEDVYGGFIKLFAKRDDGVDCLFHTLDFSITVDESGYPDIRGYLSPPNDNCVIA